MPLIIQRRYDYPRLREFQNRVLSIFGSKKEEVTGGWK